MLLEEEGVAGGELLPRAAAVEREGLLGRAADRVDQLELRDTEVVLGLDLGEDLLDRGDLGVPPRLEHADERRLVVEDVDGVIGRAGLEAAVGGRELDPVERVAGDLERAAERPVGDELERTGRLALDHQLAARHRDRGRDAQHHPRASQRRHVARVLDRLRREARVLREAVLEVDARDVRHVHDIEAEEVGPHSVRLHEVLGTRRDVEHHVAVAGLAGLDRHRPALPLRPVAALQRQLDLVGVEALEVGDDGLVGATGHGGVAGLQPDRVRAPGRARAPGREQERHRVADEGRAQKGGQHPGRGHAREQAAHPLQAAPLHEAPVVDLLAAPLCLLDQAPRQVRGDVGAFPLHALGAQLHGAQERRLQRRIVLLDVERDPLVRQPDDERQDEEADAQAGQGRPGEDAERRDGGGRVTEVVHAPGRRRERQ